MSEVHSLTRMARAMCRTWVNDFQRHAWEFLLSCISSLFSLKLTSCCVFWLSALGPTVILRALTCLDEGPETGGFSHVLVVVGIISIFMYYGDDDNLMNGPTAAVVIFFLLMCVKRLLLSPTPLLRYDRHACTHLLTPNTHQGVYVRVIFIQKNPGPAGGPSGISERSTSCHPTTA